MAEGEKASSVVGSTFEIFDIAKFVEEACHDFVAALLRYILDEHFLPHLLFRPHWINLCLLGTPSGFTVMFPPCVIIGVMVNGSNTNLISTYPLPGCTYSCEEASNNYNYLL